MSTQNYQSAWTAYRDAVAGLYARPLTAMAERGEGDIVATPDLVNRAQTLVSRSQQLGEAAASSLALPDPNQRELAQLQLLAAAAMDLSIANDLVRRAEAGVPDEVVERGATLPTTLRELQSVLSIPTEQGIQALMKTARLMERGAAPTDPQAAKAALRETVESALADIREDAAAVGQAAFVALAELPTPPIQQAASAVLSELMLKVGESASALVSKAASLVVQAIDKLMAALGKEAQDAARQQAAEWIKDLQKGTLFDTLLKQLYEPELIQKDVDKALEQTSDGTTAEPFNTASQRVSELAAKFRKQKQVLTYVIHGLTFARPWLMTLPPWGPLGITAAYVVGIGYIVYAGGDYVDWFRTGATERLNFVPGVRTLVRQALA